MPISTNTFWKGVDSLGKAADNPCQSVKSDPALSFVKQFFGAACPVSGDTAPFCAF
jgi:hypothetical protein